MTCSSRISLTLRASVLATLAMALLPIFGAAQSTGRNAPEPAMVVIPERIASAIQQDIDNAIVTRDLAVARRSLAIERLKSIDPAVQAKKQAIGGLDQKKNEAKKAKRESELVSIEAEKRAAKQVVDLLNRLKELRKAEVEAAEAEAQLAEAQIRSYQLELELSKKRDELYYMAQDGSSSLNQTAAGQVVNDLEARLLKLQEEQANATQKLASKEKDIVKRRLSLFKAQVQLGAPRV